MQRTGDQLLSRPRCAAYQDRDVGVCQPADGAEDLLHGGRLADDFLGGFLFGRRRRRFFLGKGHGPFDDGDGFVHVERFGQILERAALVGVDGAVEVGMGRHDDDRQLRVGLVDATNELHAVHAGHSHVGKDGDGPLVLQVMHGVIGRGESGNGNVSLLHGPLQHPAYGPVVVDDPDSISHGCEFSSCSMCSPLLSTGRNTEKRVSPGRLTHSMIPL